MFGRMEYPFDRVQNRRAHCKGKAAGGQVL